jgi:hypothetical protein
LIIGTTCIRAREKFIPVHRLVIDGKEKLLFFRGDILLVTGLGWQCRLQLEMSGRF